MNPNRLITISVSHYCEKARWALERCQVPFTEERHLPVFHSLSAWRAGGKRTVPVLITPLAVFNDSSDILAWLDEHHPGALYPKDGALRRQTEDWENLFDEKLGPHTRRAAYYHLLHKDELAPSLSEGVNGLEKALFKPMLPILRLLMKKGLNLTTEGYGRSLQKIEEVFAKVEECLADGRRYLVGDQFSAADLTFATLAAPILSPPEYGVRLPTPEEMPPELSKLVKEWRARPVGQFGLRIYREERRHPAQS